MDLYILDAISSPPSRIVKTMSLDTDQGIVFSGRKSRASERKKKKEKEKKKKPTTMAN